MKKLLVTLALILAPVVASAAPQTVVIEYAPATKWAMTGAVPTIPVPGGTQASGRIEMTTRKASGALLDLEATNGKAYLCKATVFYAYTDTVQAFNHFGVSSLRACTALN